jgi:hypothetical protein
MKFDRNKAFPYPVLRPFSDDYIDVEFQATAEFEITAMSVDVHIQYALSSQEIADQIEAGNASYVAVVSCRDTYFRNVLPSQDRTVDISFDPGILRGEVAVDSYVIATKEIKNFTSPDINPEFGATGFLFTPGDVLAQDETQISYIDRDLFRPVTSVFDLVQNEQLSGGEWKVNLDEDHVRIEISPSMKGVIDDARNDTSKRVILLNALYFPAVTQALQQLKTNKEDYEDKRWAAVMEQKLHHEKCSLDQHEAYVLAQRLMKQPLQVLENYVLKGKD